MTTLDAASASTTHTPVPLPTRMARAIEESAAADRLSALLAPFAGPVGATALGDLLRDRLVGHALHPALTDVPIAAWTASTVIDVRGRRAERRAATAFEALGLLAAVPTALTGLAEWSRTAGADRRVGSAHAAVNTLALGLHAASWAARRSGRHGLGVTTGLLGNAVVGVSAFLGGHLTTVRKVGSSVVPPPPTADPR
ncbi:MAG TPA: DUF2231 domain-containing protein [Phycicoccus sp.]